MSAEQERCARYIVACINEFAQDKKLNRRASFRYLYNNKGIALLKEHYEIEHTLSMQDAIDALTHICRRNGGAIQCFCIIARQASYPNMSNSWNTSNRASSSCRHKRKQLYRKKESASSGACSADSFFY